MKTSGVENYVPSDIVGGIVAYLKSTRFSGSTETIHTNIARLRAYYPLLRRFSFSRHDAFPYSRRLEQALSVLQRSRKSGMENPDFDTYIVSDEAKSYFQVEVLPRFTEAEREQLKEIAEVFEAECPPPL